MEAILKSAFASAQAPLLAKVTTRAPSKTRLAQGAGPAGKAPLTSLEAYAGFAGPAAAHGPPDWKTRL